PQAREVKTWRPTCRRSRVTKRRALLNVSDVGGSRFCARAHLLVQNARSDSKIIFELFVAYLATITWYSESGRRFFERLFISEGCQLEHAGTPKTPLPTAVLPGAFFV